MSVNDLVARALAGDLNHQEDQCDLTEKLVLPAMPEITRLVTASREKINYRHQLLAERQSDQSANIPKGDRDLQKYPGLSS